MTFRDVAIAKNGKKYINESLIQHELYRRLVNRGINVIPEYRYSKEHRKRADLAIFNSAGQVLLLIEVKNRPTNCRTKITKQYRKYIESDIDFMYKFDARVESILYRLERIYESREDLKW